MTVDAVHTVDSVGTVDTVDTVELRLGSGLGATKCFSVTLSLIGSGDKGD